MALPADLGGGDPASQVFALHHAPDAGVSVADGEVVGGESVPLTYDPAGLTDAQLARFPQLSGYLALHLPDGTSRADVESWLTGKVLVSRGEAGGPLVAATGVQIPGVLDDLYAGSGERRHARRHLAPGRADRRGCGRRPPSRSRCCCGRAGTPRPTRSAWRCSARTTAPGRCAARRSWRNAAYRFEVTVYAPTTDAVEVNDVTDPYSVALTTNSTHSVLVDLDDRWTQPWLWRVARQPVVAPVDQTIYELHVRDFSINDQTVPAALRGTYGAFSYPGSGMRHLWELARAGLTTVHLLPTFDIASIEEDRSAQQTPPCDLASFAPDSPEQQACIAQVADTDGFNWGYDPLHWSTPEGSYAVHPDGASRVVEYRQMVGSLHAIGLQVVADEVFNHTAASGQDDKSRPGQGRAGLLPPARTRSARSRPRPAARTWRPSTSWRRR